MNFRSSSKRLSFCSNAWICFLKFEFWSLYRSACLALISRWLSFSHFSSSKFSSSFTFDFWSSQHAPGSSCSDSEFSENDLLEDHEFFPSDWKEAVEVMKLLTLDLARFVQSRDSESSCKKQNTSELSCSISRFAFFLGDDEYIFKFEFIYKSALLSKYLVISFYKST